MRAATEIIKLQDAAEVRPGYPFRGAIVELRDGDAAVVHLRDADPDTGVNWAALSKTELTGRKKPDWLQCGDILFAARGNRNFAVDVGEPMCDAVCSPHFFLVRTKQSVPLLPSFLAWLMNQAEAKRYFAASAEGTLITSIRRQVLEELPVAIPSLDAQHRIVDLHKAAVKERQLLNQLIENRQQQLQAISRDIFSRGTL